MNGFATFATRPKRNYHFFRMFTGPQRNDQLFGPEFTPERLRRFGIIILMVSDARGLHTAATATNLVIL